MKYLNYLLILVIAVSIASCKKDNPGEPVVQPPPPPPVIEQPVLLKDLIVAGLPSPYYHFEYDDAGQITKSGFSSGLRTYDILYNGPRIEEIRSTHILNKDRLTYRYESGQLALIKYINEAGINFKNCFLTYNAAGQLVEMEWDIRVDPVGFALAQTMKFTYYANGNLMERRDQKHVIPGQQAALLTIDRYENYDNKTNVDGFTQYHDEDHHLLLLPGITIQKNNPLKNTRTGTAINYNADYTYTYDDKGRPVAKRGDFQITSGPNAGQRFQGNISFSYYR